jgi:glycosyltransferase involved in cell wall biosynthesis
MGQNRKESERTRVLFVHPTMSPFIQADLDLLKKHFDVRVEDIGSRRKGLASSIGALYHMFKGVLWADVTFCWFAEKHAKWAVRLSRMLGRPSLVVVGGYEVANLPEIGHGSLLDPKKAKMVRYIHERATIVLPVHESLKTDAIRNLGVDGGNIVVLATGFNPEKFKPSGDKTKTALTVALFDSWQRARLKGIETFVETAALMPDVEFMVIGGSGEGLTRIRSLAPSNVTFIGPSAQEEVIQYYQRARVYCQLSLYEGLPNALCEAMLCECVPVGTEVNGISTAIGDTGFYVPVGDAKTAADAVRIALASNKGRDARARIVSMFAVEKREKELSKIVEELAG